MKELKEKILEKISEKELEERIKAKIEKFSGMLNEEGALFLIARENAINLEQENTVVSKLKKGNSINFEGEILSVYPEREFESKGKLLIYMGNGQHKIKKKAEQLSCMEALSKMDTI